MFFFTLTLPKKNVRLERLLDFHVKKNVILIFCISYKIFIGQKLFLVFRGCMIFKEEKKSKIMAKTFFLSELSLGSLHPSLLRDYGGG